MCICNFVHWLTAWTNTMSFWTTQSLTYLAWPTRIIEPACFTYFPHYMLQPDIILCYAGMISTPSRNDPRIRRLWESSPELRSPGEPRNQLGPRSEEWGVIDTKLFSPFHFAIDWGQLTIIFSQSLVKLRPGLQTYKLNYFSNWLLSWLEIIVNYWSLIEPI